MLPFDFGHFLQINLRLCLSNRKLTFFQVKNVGISFFFFFFNFSLQILLSYSAKSIPTLKDYRFNYIQFFKNHTKLNNKVISDHLQIWLTKPSSLLIDMILQASNEQNWTLLLCYISSIAPNAPKLSKNCDVQGQCNDSGHLLALPQRNFAKHLSSQISGHNWKVT